jgi:TetR/AcrR family transcriptional repressor of nem operon
LAAYIEEYLSTAHITHAGAGCPVAALGADAGRQGSWLSPEFIEGAEKLIQRVSEATRTAYGGNKRRARAAAIRTLTQLVGAVVVARAVGSGPLQDEVLAACADGLARH